MIIEPIHPEFQGITITRSGGIAGIVERLEVGSDLEAQVKSSFDGHRSFQLTAEEAAELQTALAQAVIDQPAASTRQGADMFEYDIEIKWNGETHRFHSVDIGAQGALHGVILVAAQLLQREDAPFHVMDEHIVSPS